MCISIDKSLVVFRNDFLSFRIFGLKTAKPNFFEEKWDKSAVFIELKCGRLQTGLADFKKQNKKKTHQTLEILLRVYC